MLDYQHPELVKRLERKLKLSPEAAETLFLDLKRFLLICVTDFDPHAPPPAIDRAWHEFILFTMDYAAFCEEYADEFIHHQPGGVGHSAEADAALTRTVEIARKEFGPLSANWEVGQHHAECQCESCAHPFPDDDVQSAPAP